MGGRTCLVLVLAMVVCVVASDGGSGSSRNSRSGAEGRCGGGTVELAANYPTGNRYRFYYSLAQLIRVRKTCRITSLTSSFFAPFNGTKLSVLEVWSDNTLNGTKEGTVPGKPIANAVFDGSQTVINEGGKPKMLNISASDPSGIRLVPGLYWIVVKEVGERFGWGCNIPSAQDPALPIVVSGAMAIGHDNGRWENDLEESAVLGFQGCIEPPSGGNNDDGDVGTIVGTVLGIIFGVCLFAAGLAALIGWLRKHKRTGMYQHINLEGSTESHYGL